MFKKISNGNYENIVSDLNLPGLRDSATGAHIPKISKERMAVLLDDLDDGNKSKRSKKKKKSNKAGELYANTTVSGSSVVDLEEEKERLKKYMKMP